MKQNVKNPGSDISPEVIDFNASQRAEGERLKNFQNATELGLGVGGLGLLGGSLYGLGRLLGSSSAVPSHTVDYRPGELEVEYPVAVAAKKRPRLLSRLASRLRQAPAEKQASGPTPPSVPQTEGQALGSRLYRVFYRGGDAPQSSGDPDRVVSAIGSLLGGIGKRIGNVNTNYPYALPATVAAAAFAPYATIKGTEWLASKRRKQELADDLRDAQEEFGKASLGQFGKPKRASADPVGEIYDLALEKQAFVNPTGLLSMYLTYALGTGGLGAWLAYQKHKSRMQKAYDDTLKARAAERATTSPPELDIAPVRAPVPVYDDEEDSNKKRS